jgi:hypothetical protein
MVVNRVRTVILTLSVGHCTINQDRMKLHPYDQNEQDTPMFNFMNYITIVTYTHSLVTNY